MEDDKKKKKNRKKKNKQATKPTENVTLASESTSDNQSHVEEIGHDSNGKVSGIVNVPDDVRLDISADRDEYLANGTKLTNLAEAEKQYWLDREATLEEKIVELQAQKDAQIQTEAFLQERIMQLMKEKDENSEKEANLKGKLSQLENDKDASIQKEDSLEQKTQQLQREIDAYMQKEASLETEILLLEGEKEFWVKKEAGFEATVNQLMDDAASLNLKVVSLEEKIEQMEREKDSWILKENSAMETIASLTNDNTKLQAQVIELEQSRESYLNETQRMKETISSLQLQINNLEMKNLVPSEDRDANYKVEAVHALVEKLIAENSESVEKVNEFYAELDQRSVKTELLFSAGAVPEDVPAQSTDIANDPDLIPDLAVGAEDRQIAAEASASEASKTVPTSENIQSLEDVIVRDWKDGELVNVDNGPRVVNSSEIIEVDEIVQIPLDESGVEETNLDGTHNDEEIDVLLTDAPLIGAPFRFISFVARYVSGADLVNKNTGKPG